MVGPPPRAGSSDPVIIRLPSATVAGVVRGVLVACVALSACSGSSASDSDGSASEPEPSISLSEVDGSVLNAVAPYDGVSAWDQAQLLHRLNYLEDIAINDCLRSEGLPAMMPAEIPDVDDHAAMTVSVEMFPDLDTLLARGFPLLEDDDVAVVPDADDPAMFDLSAVPDECLEAGAMATREARDLQQSMFQSWMEVVLGDVEQDGRLLDLEAAFSSCLVERSGVPEELSARLSYIGWVDGKALEGEDPETRASILREGGQIYAQCGEEYFTLHEEVLSGRVRDEFLDEHSVDIARLSEFIYGDGAGPAG